MSAPRRERRKQAEQRHQGGYRADHAPASATAKRAHDLEVGLAAGGRYRVALIDRDGQNFAWIELAPDHALQAALYIIQSVQLAAVGDGPPDLLGPLLARRRAS